MLLRAALALALLAAGSFGVWEVRRWFTPEGRDLISPKQRLLRLWGLFFLLAVLGLWLGGTFLPTPHTPKALIRWIQYWMLTVLASLPLIPLALLDWRENLRRLAASRKKLFQETLGSLPQSSADPPPTTPA
jgi:hypothetical protein